MEIKGDPSLKEAGEGEGFGGWRKGTWAGGRSLFGETPGGRRARPEKAERGPQTADE